MQHTGTVSFNNPVKIQYRLIHAATLPWLVVLRLDELPQTNWGTAEDRWPMPVLRSIAAAIAIKSKKWTVNKQAASQDCGGRRSHWLNPRFPNYLQVTQEDCADLWHTLPSEYTHTLNKLQQDHILCGGYSALMPGPLKLVSSDPILMPQNILKSQLFS